MNCHNFGLGKNCRLNAKEFALESLLANSSALLLPYYIK